MRKVRRLLALILVVILFGESGFENQSIASSPATIVYAEETTEEIEMTNREVVEITPEEKYWQYEEVNGGVSIIGYDDKEETKDYDYYNNDQPFYKLIIPDTLGGKPVVQLADQFTGVEWNTGRQFSEVQIPDTVTTMGYVFNGNNSFCFVYLQDVTLSTNLKELCGSFYMCPNLKSIELPDGLEKIGTYTFADCTSLTSMNIPATVTEINPDAFYCSNNIQEYIVAEGNERYYSEDGVLYSRCYDYDDNGELIYTDKVTVISYPGAKEGSFHLSQNMGFTGYTFSDANLLTSITVDDENDEYTSLDGVVYSKDTKTLQICPRGRTEDVIIQEGVTTISNSAFENCNNIKNITIPKSVIAINKDAFDGDSGYVIYGYAGSEAESFAKLNGIAFVNMDDNTELESSELVLGSDSTLQLTDEGFLTGVLQSANTVSEVSAHFATSNLVFKDSSGSVLGESDLLGTGSTISSMDGETVKACCEVVLVGDVKADGKVNNRDVAMLAQSLVGKTELSAAQTAAADTKADGKVNNRDVAMLAQSLVGKSTISSTNTVTTLTLDESNCEWKEENGGISIYGMPGNVDKVVVPEEINELPVKAIYESESGDGDYDKLVSVTLPDTVEIIGEYAFEECYNLESISIPESVKQITHEAFTDTKWLTNRMVEAGTGYVVINDILLCRGALNNSTTITIPPGVVRIGGDAFRHDTTIETVVLPETVKEIGGSAFAETTELQSINLENVESIKSSAFYESNIAKADLSNVFDLGASAFGWCQSLEEVTLGNVLKEIPKNCFEYTALSSITIPFSVTVIGETAFYGANKLATVEMSENVSFVGENAFYICPWWDEQVEKAKASENQLLIIGKELVQSFSDKETIEVPAGVVTIGERAFFQSTVKEIILPEGITTIDFDAFKECNFLEKINLPTTLIKIGNEAFAFCFQLKEIIVPENVTEIPYECFLYCESLESVTLPATLTTIGQCAFSDCTALKSITIPASVTTFIGTPFLACWSLQEVTFLCSEFSYQNPNFGYIEEDYSIFDLVDYEHLTVKGPKNSTIQKYCEKNDITFVAMD